MTFRLLSCDGGGIRGYLSCLILQGLHTKTKLLDKADGFAGNSTGGLIAISLADGRAQGKDMDELIARLVKYYRCSANEIFRENAPSLLDKAIDELLKTFGLGGGPGIAAAQYLSTGIAEIAGELVGDRKLSSIPKSMVLAVSTVCLDVDAELGWQPFTLSNQPLKTGPDKDMRAVALADAALATSAAPTYFPPHRIVAGGTDYGYFADGGTFANNPVMNGIEIALVADPTRRLEDIQAVSVGTGLQPMAIPEKAVGKPTDWGMLQWFGIASEAPSAALLEMALAASAENQTRIADEILNRAATSPDKKRLVRLNPPLSKKVGLATHTDEAYKLMDEAFAAAEKSPEWVRAVNMANAW